MSRRFAACLCALVLGLIAGCGDRAPQQPPAQQPAPGLADVLFRRAPWVESTLRGADAGTVVRIETGEVSVPTYVTGGATTERIGGQRVTASAALAPAWVARCAALMASDRGWARAGTAGLCGFSRHALAFRAGEAGVTADFGTGPANGPDDFVSFRHESGDNVWMVPSAELRQMLAEAVAQLPAGG